MVAYQLDTTSPTVRFSDTTASNIVVRISYSGADYTSTTVTDDPWQRAETTYSNVTYISPTREPEVDWAALRQEQRRAASMVPPPRENRAKERRHLKVRKGFQQMCRLPCYRGVRYR